MEETTRPLDSIPFEAWQAYMSRRTPCGTAWAGVRRWVRQRDERARKWVFALGWVMGLRWYMNLMKKHKSDLHSALDAQVEKQLAELVDKARLETLK